MRKNVEKRLAKLAVIAAQTKPESEGKSNWRQGMPRLQRRDGIFILIGVVFALACFGIGRLIYDNQTPIPYQSNGITERWVPATVKHWQPQIVSAAKTYNIDPDFVAIIMTMESAGDAQAVSPDGAIGLMQVTPVTASDIAARLLKKPVTHYNLKNPSTNIEFGVAYLAWLRDQFGTAQQGPTWVLTTELVADGYDGGPGAANAIEEGKGLTDTEPVVYSRDAFNMWRERNDADSQTFDRWVERGGSNLLTAAQQSQQSL